MQEACLPFDKPVSQEQRDARAAELLVQDWRQVSKRFVECVMADTFPEEGDLMCFGVGHHRQYLSRRLYFVIASVWVMFLCIHGLEFIFNVVSATRF